MCLEKEMIVLAEEDSTAEKRRTAHDSSTSLYFLFVLEDKAVAAAMGKAEDGASIVALVTFIAEEGIQHLAEICSRATAVQRTY